MNAEPISGRVALPAYLLDVIAERAACLVREPLPVAEPASPYLHGWRAAAGYLGVSESTLKHSQNVPRRKLGGVVVFRRDELDAWLDDHYEGARRYRRNGSTTVPYRPSGRPRDGAGSKENPA